MRQRARPAVIIFGAAVRPDGSASGVMQARVAAALRTGRRLADPIYVPTGGQGRFGSPEAVVMADLLSQAGVARDAIVQEPTAVNTLRSAVACARLLGPERRRVYVATSAYHMARCVLLLRLAGVRAWPGQMPDMAASRRWGKRWFWRLREVPAIPIDGALLLARGFWLRRRK